jgi:hypothetical protein
MTPMSSRAGLRRRWRPASVSLAILTLVSFGACGKSPNGPHPPTFVEDTAKIELTWRASGFASDALYPVGEFAIADAARPEPVAFRRGVQRFDEVVGYTFSDSVAGRPQSVRVMVCKYVKSTTQVVKRYAPQDPTPADSSDRLVDKLANGDSFQTLLLRRDATTATGWRVSALSEHYLVIDDHRPCVDCHAKIHEVRVTQGAQDHVMPISDFIGVDSLVHVSAGMPVEVTATIDNSAHLVLLHDASGSRRLAATAPGSPMFQAALVLGGSGLRHFTIESVSDSSVYADSVHVSEQGYTFTIAVD